MYYELALRSEQEERQHYLLKAREKYRTITSAHVFVKGDPFVPQILFQEGLVACALSDWKLATKRFKRSAIIAEGTTLLRQRLKHLLVQGGQRHGGTEPLPHLLREAVSLANAFCHVSPVNFPAAAMDVAELAIKSLERVFDKPEAEEYRYALKKATKYIHVRFFVVSFH